MAWIAGLAVLAWQYTPGLGTAAAPSAKTASAKPDPLKIAAAEPAPLRPAPVPAAPAAEAPRVVYQGSVTGSTTPARPAGPAAPPVVAAAPVPQEAAPQRPVPQAAPAPAPQATAALETSAGTRRVDLNTAPVSDLNALGGGMIGRAIVQGRPYATPEELLSKRVLNRATFERIKDQIAAN
ncbi:helix-hairpin-helix domain-containing protein [Salinarimonas soli]|uniref:Helix-hairpin-helix domain-containing protein n=2 Tax=Salinarimonas soli TaxID=1638099 RepID=A0A5B2V9R7_9HYPH|nr:helix-hairpin-helix domain-containing protein [Salinarimonas soli]